MTRRLGLGALLTVLLATALAAQPDPRARLAGAERDLRQARARAVAFDGSARASTDAAERARAEQAALGARIQASESALAAAEARLETVELLRRGQERRLAAARRPIVTLTAALQTMARRPTGATLVQPGSIRDMAHVQALLTTLAPQIEARATALRGEVNRARHLRAAAMRAVAAQRTAQAELKRDQIRLASLEAEQRRRAAAFASSARLEGARATQIADESRDLSGLVRRLDADAALRERLASLPGPAPRPARLVGSLPVDAPQQAASSLRLRLPAIGPVLSGFGERLPSGARSRGVMIGARPGALVVAPAPGRVSFAGLFRGYGAIAILDHGQGFTSLITGLEANTARIGDIVQQGSPIGRAGRGGIAVELRQGGQPVDLSQFVA